MNSVASQMESPEDVLKHRLQFISELLSLCRSSVDCKDDPEQALVLYSAILDSILSSVLHGYIEVELLNIRFAVHRLLSLAETSESSPALGSPVFSSRSFSPRRLPPSSSSSSASSAARPPSNPSSSLLCSSASTATPPPSPSPPCSCSTRCSAPSTPSSSKPSSPPSLPRPRALLRLLSPFCLASHSNSARRCRRSTAFSPRTRRSAPRWFTATSSTNSRSSSAIGTDSPALTPRSGTESSWPCCWRACG